MAIHLEPLSGGLVNRLDPVFLTAGDLVETTNARYAVGDPSIRPAFGRIRTNLIADFVSPPFVLAWDVGIVHIIYHPPQGQIVLSLFMSDPSFGDPFLGLPQENVAQPEGPLDWYGRPETVSLETMKYAVLSGSWPIMALWRDNELPSFRHLGMKQNDVSIRACRGVTNGSTADFLPQYFWFTWYNSVVGIEREGTATLAASQDQAFRTGVIISQANTFRSGQSVHLLIKKSDFVAPSWADKIRVYMSDQQAFGSPNPYPKARLIGSQTIASLGSPTTAQWNEIIANEPVDPPGSQEDWYRIALNIVSFNPGVERDLFATVAISVDGVIVDVGRDGEPPEATTGDAFEESLVTNDRNDRRKIRYSVSGEFGSFPSLYYLNMDSKNLDQVIAIRALGRRLGVFLKNQVWVVNWLPRTGDDEFGRGRVKDVVCENRGVLTPDLVTTFTMPSVGPLIAWWNNGLYATDLNTWIELAPHFDPAIPLGPFQLIDNPDEYRLELWCNTAVRGTVWYFHYHESHLRDGKLTVTGPIERPGGAKAVLIAETMDPGVRRVATLDRSGAQLYEGYGTQDASLLNVDSQLFSILTREIYLNGAGNEFQTNKLFAHVKPSGDLASRYGIFALMGPTEVVKADIVPQIESSQLNDFDAVGFGEFIQIGISGTSQTATAKFNMFGVDWDDLGSVNR